MAEFDRTQIGVPGLTDSTVTEAGRLWLHCSADCSRPLYDNAERDLILAAHGFDPKIYWDQTPHLFQPCAAGTRTWWYAQNSKEQE